MSGADSLHWQPRARMITYAPDTVERLTRQLGHEPTGDELRYLEQHDGLIPDEVGDWVEGNLVTSVGKTRIANLFIASGAAAFTNTLGFAGVGNSATAETVSDTVLGGNGNSTTAWYKGLDASNPSVAASTITANCTFQSADGNFTWAEWMWGILNSGTVTAANALASVGTGAAMFNHKVQALGSKASGSISTLNSQLVLS